MSSPTNDTAAKSDIPQGIAAATVTFITSFLKKPWQQAFPLIEIKNRTRVLAFVLLYLGIALPILTVMGEEFIIGDEISDLLSFILTVSAITAVTTFVLGVSSSIPRTASKVVLGCLLFAIGNAIWEVSSLILDLQEVCNRQCGNIVNMAFSEFGLGDRVWDTLGLGLFFFIGAVLMMFPCAFSKKVQINEKLVSTLKTINATTTNTRVYTNEDVSQFSNSLQQKSVNVLVAITTKFNKSSSGDNAEMLKSLQQKMAKPIIKKCAIVVAVLFAVWLVWPSSVDAPDKLTVEKLLKAEPEIQQLAAMSSLIGGNNTFSLNVASVDDCESYTFDDGDTGVSCSIEIIVNGLTGNDSSVENGLFYNHPNRGWEYHGSL